MNANTIAYVESTNMGQWDVMERYDRPGDHPDAWERYVIARDVPTFAMAITIVRTIMPDAPVIIDDDRYTLYVTVNGRSPVA